MHGITNLLPYTILDLALGDQDDEVFWLLASSSGMVGHVQQVIIICQLFKYSNIPVKKKITVGSIFTHLHKKFNVV